MCEAVCDVGGVTVSKAVKLSVLPSDSGEDINFLETLVDGGGNGRCGQHLIFYFLGALCAAPFPKSYHYLLSQERIPSCLAT